jgi:hypothetical protein
VGLGFLTSRIDYVHKVAHESTTANLYNPADRVPVIVIGDGIEEGVARTCVKNEQVFKRLNIRGLVVEHEDIALVLAVLAKLNLQDIKVFNVKDFMLPDDFPTQDLRHQWSMNLPQIWENGVVIPPDLHGM